MKDRLVQNCSQILCFLLKGRHSINNIIEQTGIYKNYVFEANRFLEQCKLVDRVFDEGVHKQKEFIQLSDFGRKLAHFIENTNKFDESFNLLKQATDSKFNGYRSMGAKPLRSLLKNRGFNDKEINRFAEDISYIRDFAITCLEVAVDVITNVYGLCLLQFNPNESAKGLLAKVMIYKLSSYLQMGIENKVNAQYQIICKNCRTKLGEEEMGKIAGANEIVEENSRRLFGIMGDFWQIPFNNRFVTKDVQDIIRCLFLITDLPKEVMEQEIKGNLQLIKDAEERRKLQKIKGIQFPNGAEEHNQMQKRLYAFCAQLSKSTYASGTPPDLAMMPEHSFECDQSYRYRTLCLRS